MPTPAPTPAESELELHTAWLRRLARRLVRDDHAADDLVQDVWRTALERPGASRPARPLLGGIARNLAHGFWRGEARRARRERGAARPEALPSAAEISAEVDLQRRVASALLALDEPYRSALFLRFYRDEPLRRVGELQGVAVSTAAERVQRGLALLRRGLDRDYGGRGAWCLLMLPWSEARNGLAPALAAKLAPVLGGLAVSATVKLAVAGTLVVGGAVALWIGTSDRAAAPLASSAPRVATAPATLVAADEALVDASREDAPRRAAPVASEASGPAPEAHAAAAETSGAVVEGRAIDLDGAPLAGVEIADAGADRALTRTDGAGRFRFPRAELSRHTGGLLVVRDPLLATVVPGQGWDHEAVLLVAGPRSTVAGRVVDDQGAPVEGARLVVETAQSLYQRLGVRRPLLADPVPIPTGAGGTFVLEGVCAGAGVFVAATRAGHERVRAELVDVPAGGLEIVLPRLAQDLTGTVIDALGAPVAEASVSLGKAIATTAADGSFHVRHDGLEAGGTLLALKRGHQPGRVELLGPPPGPVVVQIGEPPLAIEGRVVDAAGEPVEGAIVWVRDPTPFGHEAHELDEFTVALERTVEDLLGSDSGATADEHGRFRLGGLLPRVYDVQAFDPRTYSLGPGWRIEAGATGAELVLSPEPGVRRVAGRVTSLGGEPVAGVSIVPTRMHLADVRHLPPVQAHVDPAAVTDAEGRFDIAALATEGTVLQLHHARLGPFRQHRIGADEDLEDLRVELPLPCRFQVDLADRPDFADGLRVLDADGAPLPLLESFGAFLTQGEEAELVGGRSSVLESDERARTLLLLRGDEEVLRLPIALSPDEPTTLRP